MQSIFVLEDDSELSVVVCQALRADGYEVTSMANGVIALADLVARHTSGWRPPDLIVTDVRLPGYTGTKVLDRLRGGGCAVPAIVMSGFVDADLRSRTGELGIVAIFEKPFDVDDLRATVRRHFSGGA